MDPDKDKNNVTMQSVANNLAYSIQVSSDSDTFFVFRELFWNFYNFNLFNFVQVAIAPTSSSEARLESSKFCNDYIQSTPPGELCEVGFILTSHSDPIVIRTGMQFLEQVAKFHWQDITEREIVKVGGVAFHF